MRLLDRRRSKAGHTVTALELPQDSHMAVHGESYRQPTLRETAKLAGDEDGERVFRAILLPEPGNDYDPNAIAVYSDAGRVGYLPRERALDYQPVFTEIERQGARAGVCTGVLTGGVPGKPSHGVVLRLSTPRACIRALQAPD